VLVGVVDSWVKFGKDVEFVDQIEGAYQGQGDQEILQGDERACIVHGEGGLQAERKLDSLFQIP